MRTIIYGAGGIGCVVGGELARTGHNVILIGRSGHVNAINEHGLNLVTPNGTHIVRVPAVTGPEQIEFKTDDVVFLTMKSQGTEEALKALKKCVSQVPVFCLQNSVRNEETAAQYFENVYGVLVRVGALFLKDGEVEARMSPSGWMVVGRYPKGTDGLAEKVVGELREAKFVVKASPDVMPYKWGKVMRNIRTAVGAITDVRYDMADTSASHTDAMELINLVRKEASDLLNEAGQSYLTDAQIAAEWPEFTITPPNYAAGEPQSSTWQSLARKQGSVETEYFNGEIVRLASKLGKRAPLNDGLNRIMQEMAAKREIPGKYTIAELNKELGLK